MTITSLLQNLHSFDEKQLLLFLVISGGALLTLFGFVIIQKHDTNRRLIEQKLELDRSNLIKDKLVSVIGHDLKAPLNSIYSLVQLLKDGSFNKEEEKDILEKLSMSTASGIEALNNIFEWGQSQLNDKASINEKVNLYSAVQSAFGLLHETASQKKIRLINDTTPDTFAKGNNIQTGFIIRNLVANAIKFSYPDSEVRVFAHESDQKVKVCVSDSGIGMDKDDISKILTSSAIFSRPGTHSEKGSGLGLQLSKEFIQKLGGELAIQSKPGEGCTFSFSLHRWN
ncbi:MAG TPA: HAMP domain-containing sensor histidine kinase [Sphingobacteriaceae bacterium]